MRIVVEEIVLSRVAFSRYIFHFSTVKCTDYGVLANFHLPEKHILFHRYQQCFLTMSHCHRPEKKQCVGILLHCIGYNDIVYMVVIVHGPI